MRKVIFTTMFLIFLLSTALAADWKHFATHVTDGNLFYDTQSVSRGQDTTRVWTKWRLSDKGKAECIKTSPEINGIENISYIINREEINCSKNVYRTMFMALYDSEGELIQSHKFKSDAEFYDVPPDSAGAAVVEAICEKKEGGK